jgi:hypothetical protein
MCSSCPKPLAAYRSLRDEGLLEFRQGRGVRVRGAVTGQAAVAHGAQHLIEVALATAPPTTPPTPRPADRPSTWARLVTLGTVGGKISPKANPRRKVHPTFHGRPTGQRRQRGLNKVLVSPAARRG